MVKGGGGAKGIPPSIKTLLQEHPAPPKKEKSLLLNHSIKEGTTSQHHMNI